MLVGKGHRNVLIMESPLSMFCLSVHHMIPRNKKKFAYLKRVLSPDALMLFFVVVFVTKLCCV